MTSYSLRTRLIAWIGLPIAISTILVLILSYHFSRHEIEEVYDAQLVHSAKVLLQLTKHEIMEDEGFHLGLENLDLQHRYERKLGFRIWIDNELLSGSPSAKNFGAFEAPPGFSDHHVGEDDWRFFVFLHPANKIKIEVSERNDIRTELVIQLMLSLILPALLFLPIILLIIWVGVHKVLKPVITISADVDRRGSDDLSPIQKDTLPQEIVPLISALNGLFNRLEDSFKREREFTDHAAHELRTPLAAMKTQTQVLMKKAKGAPEFSEGFENLQSSINRAARLVEQLLLLARLQHENLPQTEIDLAELLRACLSEIASRAKQKSIKIHSDIVEKCMVNGHSGSLLIMLGNLLDNAVKYTPAGGEISVSLTQEGKIVIADHGCGLNDSEKKEVFARFVRADKTGQTGSGLGLSISQWIADAHKVKIVLKDNQPKGLIVEIKWQVIQVVRT